MGYAQVWLAVRASEKPLNEFLGQAGFRRTGQFQEDITARFVVAQTRNGWSVLIANRAGDKLVRDDKLESLSADCEIVAGEAEEHVMVSWLSAWRDGRKVWSVAHFSDKGREHLDVWGEPPEPLLGIRARLIEEARQAGDDGVDYVFDIPTELSRVLIGYKHDAGVDSTDAAPYEILESLETPLPFWKRMLGVR